MTHLLSSDEPSNMQRALWAKAALTVFTAETYGGDNLDSMDEGDVEDAVADLICDLLHFATLHPRMDAVAIHGRALRLFEEEIEEQSASEPVVPPREGHPARSPFSRDTESEDLLEALLALTRSLHPPKIAPVLEAAGYSVDLWRMAHRNACQLISKETRRKALAFRLATSAPGRRHAVFWMDDRFQIEIRRNASQPMASAQLVLKIYPITEGAVWDQPYETFIVDEDRIIELETEMKE